MVKAVHPSNSVFSDEQLAKIINHYDPQFYDRCVDDPQSPEFSVDGMLFPYTKKRTLLVWQAERAMRYIAECVKIYPFQLRRDLAYPMWMRFEETWDLTGDLNKAMREI